MAKFPSVLHKRDTYIGRIKPFMRSPIVKVMIGHRRVGKSFILFQLIDLIKREEKDANIIYVNKEDIDFDNMLSYEDLHEYISSRLVNDRKNYIFVDEIQEIGDFKIAIRSLALDDNNDIYITGSNSDMFSSDLANELGERYVEFRIYSLSYLEFLSFHNLSNNDESLERYIHFGGLTTEEIDFVCTRGGEMIYVQVAIELSMPDTIEREFGNLLKIKDNYPKIVVSGEHSFENSYEGVEHIYIRDFLSSTLTPKIL